MKMDLVDFLSRVGGLLTRRADYGGSLNPLLEFITDKIGGNSCFLLLFDKPSDGFAIAASHGLSISKFRKLEHRVDHHVFRDAYEKRRETTIDNLPSTPGFEYLASGHDESLAVVPVALGDVSLGILCLSYQRAATLRPVEINKVLNLVGAMIAQNLRVERAVLSERQKLVDENSHLRQELREKHDFSHIIGTSNAMKHVFDQVTQVARSNATVMLRGESGTGKEMIANAIHYNSLRSKRPLIKINCAALPDTLIESELFGHEKGAFTGAERAKKGRFELADGGTLFLDEIGDLPLQTQIKLLRALQEREFQRLGGSETIKANIRLITATNKNLETAIALGQFREDLYYRLNVFTISLPPLRERRSDILLLAEHFLEKFEAEHGKRIRRISTPAIDMLMSYHFPGNVRELENAIERAVIVCDSNVLHGHHLPPTLQTAELSGTVTALSLKSGVEAFERGMIQDALKSTKGNIAKAARQLDSSERILGYKIRKYRIEPSRFRQ